ncbi:MAG: hypothetical protein M0Z99_27220 [Betaproteobacteria bacterium]|nr:hypothetical protein [Betaproteobacteria bacterium]
MRTLFILQKQKATRLRYSGAGGFFLAAKEGYSYVHNNPTNANDPSGLADYIYKPGSPTAMIENQLKPGANYFVDNGAGTRYPAGVNVAKNLSQGKGFDQLWGPEQTRFTINQGIRDIVGLGGPVSYGSNSLALVSKSDDALIP